MIPARSCRVSSWSRRGPFASALLVVWLASALLVAQAPPPVPALSAVRGQAAPPAPVPAPLAPTATPQPAAPNRLPVRRVILYKNGVGYFEHVGRVRGNQTVTVDFTSGQLNDVLKSLTALDLDGGRVSGVSYNSQAGLERRIGALRLPVGQEASRAEFLSALRGARLDVRTGASRVVGRLLSVEQTTRTTTTGSSPIDTLTLVTDAGEMQTVALDPGVVVRIAEPDLNQEVGRYLSLVASVRDQDLRRLAIATTGTGERDLFVSYVSEVPVWKATYRLVLPATGPGAAPGAKPLLQGWAIVDNTVGEDWENVELSLVAGAPQSFIQQISQPYYVQRPVVPLPDRVLLTPQTHLSPITAPASNITLDGVSAVSGERSVTAGGGGGRGGGAAFRSAGNVGGVVGGIPAAPPPVPMQERVDSAMSAFQATAAASQLGDLFEYKLTSPVTIRKNQSALVPILSGAVVADKVSLWTPTSGARPFRALWLTNSTPLTLDGGTFSIVEGNAFAGEGLIDPLKAGERRLISYAVDLAVTVDARSESSPVRITKATVARGILTQLTEERQRRTYTARNEDSEARVLVLEHPIRTGWTIGGTIAPAESTAAVHRFRVPVAPKTTVTFVVEETRPVQAQISVSSITDNQIAVLVRDQALSATLQASLREIQTKKAEVARLSGEAAARQREIDQIGRDQERVRENMRALKGSAEERQLVQRYVKQLDDQETRIEVLRREQQALAADAQRAQAELNQLIERLAG